MEKTHDWWGENVATLRVKLSQELESLHPLFFKKYFSYLFIYLATLGLRCGTWAFSSCSEQGLLFVAVHGLLIAVASLVAEHRL